MNTVLNRPALKAQARELLRTAQVSPKAFMVLYYSVLVLLDVLISFLPSEGLAGMFITTLSELFSWVLGAGLVLYFMGIRRRERMEFATLFDGFSFAGKLIALNLVVNAFTALWSLLLVFPGFIAFYRYRFAAYNLYENPDIGIFEALEPQQAADPGHENAALQPGFELFWLDRAGRAAEPDCKYLSVHLRRRRRYRLSIALHAPPPVSAVHRMVLRGGAFLSAELAVRAAGLL